VSLEEIGCTFVTGDLKVGCGSGFSVCVDHFLSFFGDHVHLLEILEMDEIVEKIFLKGLLIAFAASYEFLFDRANVIKEGSSIYSMSPTPLFRVLC
jgi:hypothetical protein